MERLETLIIDLHDLLLKDKKIIKEFTTNDGLAGNVIFKITSFEDNNIWICTGAGLSKLTHNGFFTFNSSNVINTPFICNYYIITKIKNQPFYWLIFWFLF